MKKGTWFVNIFKKLQILGDTSSTSPVVQKVCRDVCKVLNWLLNVLSFKFGFNENDLCSTGIFFVQC